MIFCVVAAQTLAAPEASPADDPLSKVHGLRAAITSQALEEDIHIEDRRVSGTQMKESTTRMLVHFKQSAGRARREILSQAPEVHPSRTLALGTGEGDHPRSRLRIIQQELPEPQWLFQRLDIPREARVRARSHGAGRTVEVRLPRQGRGGADRIIELNANGLPTSVKTFGPRGVVLDALTIHWQTIAGRAFPSDAILVQISRKNIVTTTIRYQAVRLNLDLSDTLFTQ